MYQDEIERHISIALPAAKAAPSGESIVTTNTAMRSPNYRRTSDRAMPGPMCRPANDATQSLPAEWSIDIANASGRPARGIEIHVEGLLDSDVFGAYYLNRFGVPRITKVAGGFVVRFEMMWGSGVQEISQRCKQQNGAATGSRRYVWDIVLYGHGNSERCVLETSTIGVQASYRWLPESKAEIPVAQSDDAPAFVWMPDLNNTTKSQTKKMQIVVSEFLGNDDSFLMAAD